MSSRINSAFRGLIGANIFFLLPSEKRGFPGQALLEYAIVLSLVVTALITVQLYVQRQLQGRYRAATNYALNEIISAQGRTGLLLQYEPYYQESEILSQSSAQIARSYSPGGASTRTLRERTLSTGRRQELPYSDEVER